MAPIRLKKIRPKEAFDEKKIRQKKSLANMLFGEKIFDKNAFDQFFSTKCRATVFVHVVWAYVSVPFFIVIKNVLRKKNVSVKIVWCVAKLK